MRRLFATFLFATVLYSVYWLAVSQAVRIGADQAVRTHADAGSLLQLGSVTTSGYPARFDILVRDPAVVHPDWTWQAAQITLQAQSYRPLTFALELPQNQQLSIAGESVQVTSRTLRAAFALRPHPDLDLVSGQVVMAGLSLGLGEWRQFGLAALEANLVQAAPGSGVYETDLAAAEITLPAAWRARIDPAGQLGETLQQISGGARLTLSAPLNRQRLGRLPDLDQLTLHDLRIEWGPLMLDLSGEIILDAVGVPTGQITLQTGQWQIVVDGLTQAGIITPRISTAISGLAGFLSGSDGILRIPVTFQDGVMLIASVPVGPAPVLR